MILPDPSGGVTGTFILYCHGYIYINVTTSIY